MLNWYYNIYLLYPDLLICSNRFVQILIVSGLFLMPSFQLSKLSQWDFLFLRKRKVEMNGEKTKKIHKSTSLLEHCCAP